MVRIEDIEGKNFNTSKDGKFVSKKTIDEMNLKVFPNNSLICSCSASLGVYAINTCPLITNQTFIGLVPEKSVNVLFLYYYMNYSTQRLKKVASGTTIPYISREKFEEFLIIFPLLKEQEKIAEILSTVDSQIDYNDKLIEKTKELKKGLMQQLLTKGIGHSEFKKTEVGEIPVEWEVKKFENVSKINQGLQIEIEERFKKDGTDRLPYITIQYINDKKNVDNQYYIENPNDSVICNENDILVSYLKSNFVQNLIQKYAGTTTIPDLKHKDFYRIPVVVPKIEEQQKIASILSSVDNQLDQYENEKSKLEELKKGLMQKLLTGEIRVK